MGCHVPGGKLSLSSTQGAWRRRVQDCWKSVVLFVLEFYKKKSEWVNFTSSEWYDLLWKNKQIQGIQKWEWDVLRSFSPQSARTSPRSWASGCRGSVCLERCVLYMCRWVVSTWWVLCNQLKSRLCFWKGYVRRLSGSGYPQDEARRCSSKSFPQNRRTIVVVVICCLMIRMVVVLLWICDLVC